MARVMCDAMDVTLETTNWTVLVQVLEKHRPVMFQRPRSRTISWYMKHVVTDTKGTKVSLIVYDTEFGSYSNLLLPYKSYLVSKAVVTPCSGSFKVSEYGYSWTLSKRILVEEVQENLVPNIRCPMTFTKFGNLFRFADRDIPLKLWWWTFFHPGEFLWTRVMREFVVINEEKIPMVICLWNRLQADEGEQLAMSLRMRQLPIIIGLRFMSTTFYGLSLTSQSTSYLMIDPPLSDDKELRSWYHHNRREITHLLDNKAFKDGSRLLPRPNPVDVIDVYTAVSTLTIVKTAWVCAEIHLLRGPFRCWYASCGNCHKAVRAEPNWTIKCPTCKERTRVEIRYRIPVILKDHNAEITAFLYTPDAEAFIPFTASDLREADLENLSLDQELAAAIAGQRVLCFLKYFEKEFHGQITRRYAIIKAYNQGYMSSGNQNPLKHGESCEKHTLVIPPAILNGVVVAPMFKFEGNPGPSDIKRDLRASERALIISEGCPLPASVKIDTVGSKAPIVYERGAKRKISNV